jgi:hypothetical protein
VHRQRMDAGARAMSAGSITRDLMQLRPDQLTRQERPGIPTFGTSGAGRLISVSDGVECLADGGTAANSGVFRSRNARISTFSTTGRRDSSSLVLCINTLATGPRQVRFEIGFVVEGVEDAIHPGRHL